MTKIIIQCAKSKQRDAGSFSTPLETIKRTIKFVAAPSQAPKNRDYLHARPDDVCEGQSHTWRDRLVEYNETYQNKGENPDDLLPAYQLYTNPAYGALVDKFGAENVFILSAGWGLVGANFLLPDYDITFSGAKNVKAFAKRQKGDSYKDFNQLPDDGTESIFLGGQAYQPLLCDLMAAHKSKKTIFYKGTTEPRLPRDFKLKRYDAKRSTNWHYSCVNDLVAGRINP